MITRSRPSSTKSASLRRPVLVGYPAIGAGVSRSAPGNASVADSRAETSTPPSLTRGGELDGVAGEAHGRVDAIGGDSAHGRIRVCVVDDVGGAEFGQQRSSLFGASGGDNPGAFGGGELGQQCSDTAGGSHDEDELARSFAQSAEDDQGGRPGVGQTGGCGVGHRVRCVRQAAAGLDGGVVGESAFGKVGLGDDAEHAVADLDVLNAVAEGVDDAGGFAAEHDRVAMLEVTAHEACGNPGIEAVHGGGGHPNPDLTRGRFGDLEVEMGGLSAGLVDCVCLHDRGLSLRPIPRRVERLRERLSQAGPPVTAAQGVWLKRPGPQYA